MLGEGDGGREGHVVVAILPRAPAADGQVHGQHDALDAGAGGALEHPAGPIPIGVDVELEPGSGIGHDVAQLGDVGRRARGEAEDAAGALGGPRRRALPFVVDQAGDRDGREQHGAASRRPRSSMAGSATPWPRSTRGRSQRACQAAVASVRPCSEPTPPAK